MDELLHGGLERGTVTVISGPTGVGVPTTFDAGRTTDAGGVIRYVWEFGDGTMVETETPTVSNAFESVGSRAVRVTAYDAAGNADSATLDVSATEAPAIRAASDRWVPQRERGHAGLRRGERGRSGRGVRHRRRGVATRVLPRDGRRSRSRRPLGGIPTRERIDPAPPRVGVRHGDPDGGRRTAGTHGRGGSARRATRHPSTRGRFRHRDFRCFLPDEPEREWLSRIMRYARRAPLVLRGRHLGVARSSDRICRHCARQGRKRPNGACRLRSVATATDQVTTATGELTARPETDDVRSDGQPGFGFLVALVALIHLVRKRQRI
ncbi:PKD domain-containing protein [Haladaptatus halobius]|uniref:PKD domain-containing protein n=1 Tax=Haladaptatus halobius TaxID=2884875 RepID=UPI001D0B6F03|nr:PKD domain-containing protein [Haladaptatus halobius]